MQKSYVAVVGLANLDIGGIADAPLISRDSNPGRVRLSVGGVGKNIAHNLRLLGTQVRMLTAISCDAFSQIVRSSCEQAGIDLRYAKETDDFRSSIYLYIDGPEGDMQLALCDAKIAQCVDPAYIRDNLPLLNAAAAIVADCNLPRETIHYLAENCTVPLFVDPVSVSKAGRLVGCLNRLHTIKPNLYETERLLDMSLKTSQDVMAAAEKFLSLGLKEVFISMGAEGMCCASETVGPFLVSTCGTSLVNATGGGDAVMAMLVQGFVEGRNIRERASLAMAAGAIAVESEEAVNPAMCMENVRKKMTLQRRLSL